MLSSGMRGVSNLYIVLLVPSMPFRFLIVFCSHADVYIMI